MASGWIYQCRCGYLTLIKIWFVSPSVSTTGRSQRRQPGRALGHLFEPVDIASLIVFRVVFGCVMLWHVWKYFQIGAIDADYIRPPFHFTWYWFDWVRPLPGPGMYLFFYTMGLLALGVLLGLHYRVCAFLLSLAFTYQFLLDQAYYLNHYYLTCLLALLMAFVPAHHAFSLDAWMRPPLRSQTAPRWALWLIRFQVGVPYFYGGLAKLAPDWLQCQPMTIALAQRSDRLPLMGPYLTETWAVWLFNYGGLAFDLLIVPALLWRRTRIPAFLVAVLFHITNSLLFDIGFFPWFMMAGTTIFFEPDWPRRLLNGLTRVFTSREWFPAVGEQRPQRRLTWAALAPMRRLGVVLLASYVFLQVVLPFRHYAMPGPVSWTELGHRFSWHMMLRGKTCAVRYYATDPRTGETMTLDLRPYLTDRQVIKLGKDADMVHQLALYLAEKLREDGYPDREIRVLDLVSLNGRKPQLLVDPRVDLAAQPRTWRWPSWLMDLYEPLRKEAWQVPLADWEKQVDVQKYIEGTPLDRPAKPDGASVALSEKNEVTVNNEVTVTEENSR